MSCQQIYCPAHLLVANLGLFMFSVGALEGSKLRGGFSNDLRETLTDCELLKHKFCLILRTFG